MLYKGYKFRRSTTSYMLPTEHFTGEQKNMVTFGKLVAEGTPGAIPRALKDGGFIYLLPIPLKGHSRTNMAYGKDGRVYLGYDGRTYTAKRKEPEVACEGYSFGVIASGLVSPPTVKIPCKYVANTTRTSDGGATINYCAECAEAFDDEKDTMAATETESRA